MFPDLQGQYFLFNDLRVISLILFFPILILPDWSSYNRSNSLISVVFPTPVFPTIPINELD